MKGIELVRWGAPAAGFLAYVKWGGVSLALAFAGLLLAVVSGLIHWHRTNPQGFFRYVRVLTVIFLLLPAIGLTLLGASSGLLGFAAALPILALAIWATRRSFRGVARSPVEDLPSMASQNLFVANALSDSIQNNNRRSQTRGALLHTQAENLDLARRNAELVAEKAVLERRVEYLERQAAMPPDPFADPIPQSRS